MPPRRNLQGDSPDPLLLSEDREPTIDSIIVAQQPEPPTKKARTSTRISAKSPASSPGGPTTPSKTLKTPSKATGAQIGTRTPLSKSVVKPSTGRHLKETPIKNSPVEAKTATLGSSTKTALPTPSRPRPKPTPKSSVKAEIKTEVQAQTPTKRKSQDVFDESSPLSGAVISRETFLANEALKRQREARNFKFKGDANAPRQTRSGRVVVDVNGTEPVDEFGNEDERLEIEENVEEAHVHVEEEGDVNEQTNEDHGAETEVEYNQTSPAISPLSAFARQHVTDILATITSQNVSSNPAPFFDEDQNEALQGLLKLLQGTVERGEGNSALLTGPRGVGKTRTVARAVRLLSSDTTSKTTPIVVKLSGHVQTNDRLAIREMGRQIAEAEGTKPVEEEGQDDAEADGNEAEYAPTTLPSHLLALLTTPSSRAIIIVIEEFDLFTEHARQALLYCLLDVVQSIKTGPVETTGRGVAVIGVTSRVDTLLLLEKRVKSRFSHRQWRVTSPLSPESIGWAALLRQALIPWSATKIGKDSKEDRKWKGDWEYAVDTLLDHSKIKKALDRLSGLTTDVRNVYKPFVVPLSEILGSRLDFMSIPQLAENVLVQIELAGWGTGSTKLKGLPHPALGILIIAKHLYYAGREEFNFAQVEEEYLRFARTKLVGIGKTRWPIGLLRAAFDHLVRVSLLTSSSNSTVQPRFAKVRCTLSPHEIVAWFKGDGGNMLGPELTTWGRVMGGHA